MSLDAEGAAWVFIMAWLGLGALVVLVLAVARYQREAEARREAARLVGELHRRVLREAMERERDATRWQRGRP